VTWEEREERWCLTYSFPKATGEIGQCWYDEIAVQAPLPSTSRATPSTVRSWQTEIISWLMSSLSDFLEKENR
jgi:hypothetical protein